MGQRGSAGRGQDGRGEFTCRIVLEEGGKRKGKSVFVGAEDFRLRGQWSDRPFQRDALPLTRGYDRRRPTELRWKAPGTRESGGNLLPPGWAVLIIGQGEGGTMASARVLIVEDELLVASDLSTSLEDFGYVVAGVAKSGEEALRKAQESRPDLVLMDIVLQGEMDGIQVAERLRSALGVPVLYLTSYGDTDKLERAKLTEPYAYLAKPWVESELKAAISLALFRHQVEKKLRESENRYRTLAENSLTGICVHQDGKFVYVNKRCAEILQYSAEELMDRPVEMVVARRTFHCLRSDLRRHRTGRCEMTI